MDNPFNITNLGDLSEPPIIEKLYVFLFLFPRDRVPREFHKLTGDYGLAEIRKDHEIGLMLGFSTPNYASFKNACSKVFLMPWSHEMGEYWYRVQQKLTLNYYLNDEEEDRAWRNRVSSDGPSLPIARAFGVQHSPEMIDRFVESRRESLERKRIEEAAQQQDRLLGAQTSGNLLEAAPDTKTQERQAKEEAEAEALTAIEEEKRRQADPMEVFGVRRRERDQQEARRKAAEARVAEEAATIEKLYEDLLYFADEEFFERPFSFEEMRSGLETEHDVRSLLDRAISEGRVLKLGEDSFQSTTELP